MNEKLKDLLRIIDQNQAKIKAFGKMPEDLLKKINYKLRLDWNYHSNKMEGGTLTREETRSVMVGNLDVKGKPFKDVAEMNGHDQVVRELLKMSTGELSISEKRIKEVHTAIMNEEDADKKAEIGKWKTKPNEVISYKGEKIVFDHPSDVAANMHDLVNKTSAYLENLKHESKKLHPVIAAADFHISFVSIHPFYDGNGRCARIFTNVILMACDLPVFIVKDVQKDAYNKLLGDIQAYGGSKDLFRLFIAERVMETQELILKAQAGEDIEEMDDVDKAIELFKRKQSLSIDVKSPRTVFESYQDFENKWSSLVQNFSIFKDLFSDFKEGKWIDNQEPKHEKRNLFEPAYLISDEPKKLKIFGHDLLGMDLEKIEWNLKFYGLKTTNVSVDFDVSLLLIFEHQKTLWSINMNNEKVNSGSMAYGDFVAEADWNDLIKELKKKALRQIEILK